MDTPTTHHPRLIKPRLTEALADSPVVLIHGPRQCGKTTLARATSQQTGHAYFSFDDDVLRSAATADPVGFVADLPDKVILDEVQRVPTLFTAIKSSIDRRRHPGRFILTGSANVLLLPSLADSLAGRMALLRLHPLAQAELSGLAGFLPALFAGRFTLGQPARRMGDELAALLATGGYPEALTRSQPRRRAAWYRDYITTLVQRDVRDLARISSVDVLPRLLAAAAGHTAQMLNVADLAAPFQLSRPTIRDYLTLLQQLFLLEELPPWFSNPLSRLVKTPKLHLCDTGVACALLGSDAASLAGNRKQLGQMLETFVLQELRRQASWQEDDIRFFYLRDKDGVEVDIVLEGNGQRIAGVEVKSSSTVTAADFKGLRKLQTSTGSAFRCGVVLYDGEQILPFGPSLYAVPLQALWQTSLPG